MSYAVINPPFTLKFREMSGHDLKDYRKWFLSVICARCAEPQAAVTASPGFESWTADRSPAFLETVGHWLARQVETRPRAADEIARIKERGTFDVDVSGQELTTKTFSIAMEVGVYFAETLSGTIPSLNGISRLATRNSRILVRW